MSKTSSRIGNLSTSGPRPSNSGSASGLSGPVKAPAGQFTWSPLRGPLTLKLGQDDRNAQDLESTPVSRSMYEFLARGMARASVPPPQSLTESYCTLTIRDRISLGGGQALEMASYFFNNRWTNAVRMFPNGSFWSNQIRNDDAFKEHVRTLTQAIQDSLQLRTDHAVRSPILLDANELAEGTGFQPTPLLSYQTNLSFSFKENGARLAGDPLTYGIGAIQGVKITMTSFSGQPNGEFFYKMSYRIWDHFGSNDGDLYDPAQACMWLLQRKMISGQDTSRFNPYIVEICVDDVPGSGYVEVLSVMGGGRR